MGRENGKSGKPAVNRIDISGQRVGRLVVLRPHRKPGVASLFYWCRCDCGNERVVGAQNLRRGITQSCGCLQKERASKASLQHGMSHTSIHNTWMSMLQRCNDKKCSAYKDYGARGVKVCDRWLDFRNFLEDMGLPPQKGLTLDRYPNNDGNYEPGNVRWATKKEQANNRRSSRFITFRGKTMTVTQWEDYFSFARGVVAHRLYNGWTVERALTQPQKVIILD